LGSKAFAEATRRQLPQIHKIADDAAARMAEWDV
jgi:hypothetical protein